MVYYIIDNVKYLDFQTLISITRPTEQLRTNKTSLFRYLTSKENIRTVRYQNRTLYRIEDVFRSKLLPNLDVTQFMDADLITVY